MHQQRGLGEKKYNKFGVKHRTDFVVKVSLLKSVGREIPGTRKPTQIHSETCKKHVQLVSDFSFRAVQRPIVNALACSCLAGPLHTHTRASWICCIFLPRWLPLSASANKKLKPGLEQHEGYIQVTFWCDLTASHLHGPCWRWALLPNSIMF